MDAIDLNADLGETVDGFPTADDEALFAVISSASIACGAHAGDAAAMHAAAERAARTGVAIGAHPSFPDRANFGRLALTMDPADLRATVTEQLAALEGAGADIRYVKPHGALYHVAGAGRVQAEAVAAAVAELSDRLGRGIPILAQGAALADAAGAVGLPFHREAFLDRGYLADGTLVPRGRPGDLLHDPGEVAARAVELVRDRRVAAVDGTLVEVEAASFCLHGDTDASLQLALAVRAALDAARIEVRAPW